MRWFVLPSGFLKFEMWALLSPSNSSMGFRIWKQSKPKTKLTKILSTTHLWILFGSVLKAWINFERSGILKAPSLETTDCGMSESSLGSSWYCDKDLQYLSVFHLTGSDAVESRFIHCVWVWNMSCRLELLWSCWSWVPSGDWSRGLWFWWSHNSTVVRRQWELKAGSGWRG